MVELAYHVVNPDASSPIIILAEHAGKAFPQEDRVGLDQSLFEQEPNLLFDLGVDGVTRLLASKLGATAILGRYSRLWVDLNRASDAFDLIPATAHGIRIPGNQQLSQEMRENRKAAAYQPFHAEVKKQIERHLDAGITPLLFSVHSFTPKIGLGQSSTPDAVAPDVGLLYMQDIPAVASIRKAVSAAGFATADNFPYDLRTVPAGGLHIHGSAYDLPVMGIEISISGLKSKSDEKQWADIMAGGLKGIAHHA